MQEEIKMKDNQIRLNVIDFGVNVTKNLIFSLKRPMLFSINRYLFLIIACLLLVSCGTTQSPAPVVDRAIYGTHQSVKADGETGAEKGKFYTVQKGDTFYSIALNHGIDHQELAEWNGINDPNSIQPGQRINLSVPIKQAQPALFALPQGSTASSTAGATTSSALSVVAPTGLQSLDSDAQDGSSDKLKTQPKAFKLPYSEQNVARLQYAVNPSPIVQTTPATEKTARIEAAPEPNVQQPYVISNDSGADWIWPTSGKLLSPFSKNSKGVKIAGQIGQSVVASASGEVVYSGHGLRGYGNLIIIKHNNVYLSAYAHNSKILVKEGESVIKGQKIAEVGNTDTDTTQLHFEIRKHGKPVDPLKYLPKEPG
jgi:lipoprotein NlpD